VRLADAVERALELVEGAAQQVEPLLGKRNLGEALPDLLEPLPDVDQKRRELGLERDVLPEDTPGLRAFVLAHAATIEIA
jgi:hypothetical protein